MLSADGTVFEFDFADLVPRGNLPGARDIYGAGYADFLTVGEVGTATRMRRSCGVD